MILGGDFPKSVNGLVFVLRVTRFVGDGAMMIGERVLALRWAKTTLEDSGYYGCLKSRNAIAAV